MASQENQAVTLKAPPNLRAAVLWGLGASLYLAAETVAAHATPGYSYSQNYISLLGEPNSPLSQVMNAGFIGEGIFYLLAILSARTALPERSPSKLWLAFGVAHGIGIILVGKFHSGQPSANAFPFHLLGAFFAIAGGNLASISFPFASHDLPSATRTTSIALGVLGLVSLLILGVNIKVGRPIIFPDGIWERGSVYPVSAWELFMAWTVVGSRCGRKRRIGLN